MGKPTCISAQLRDALISPKVDGSA